MNIRKMAGGAARPLRYLVGVVVVAFLASGLGACSSADDIELQGGIFDVLGVSGNLQKAAEPKVARRNGLIVPPDRQSLPAPGSGRVAVATPAAGDQSWPTDPEKGKATIAAQEKAKLAKYCGDAEWWKRSNPEEFNRMTQNGNLCQSALSKYFGKKTNTQ